MFNIRKLAALDIVFLGPLVIIIEFAVGVVGPLVLGLWTFARSHSTKGMLVGVYFLLLGLNYIPLLLHAIDLATHHTAQQEIADEVGEKQKAFRKYRRQSLLLLLPFVVPVLALLQSMKSTQRKEPIER